MRAWCRCPAVMAAIFLALGGCRENADHWNRKAYAAFAAGKREEAIAYCNKALALEQNNVLAHFSLGLIYKMEGRDDKAVLAFKKVIALNPDLAGAYANLGDLYRAKGMLDEAIAAYGQVISRQPESALAHYNMGVACKDKGDLAAAADYLFDAGLFAIVYSEKHIATDAYLRLKEIGNEQRAQELQAVLGPWFDPAQDPVPKPG